MMHVEEMFMGLDSLLVLAQGEAASPPAITGVPGEPAAGEGKAITNGAPTGGGGPPPQIPWWSNPIYLIMILLLGMMVMVTLSGRKERKRRAALLASIKKQDRVQTAGGIIGTIVEMQGDEVVLRVDEGSNTKIRFARSAIQQVLREGKGDQGAPGAEPAKERQTA